MNATFNACGVVTITTDFGQQDPFVATMKGRILTRLPTARIVDVTHEVPAYWPAEAGFWLLRAFEFFPSGSVHLGVVDPGVGTDRDIIVVQAREHMFVAPDNGLLAPIVGKYPDAAVHRLDLKTARQRFNLGTPSATFHGRDILAPIAAEIAAGRATLADIGPAVTDIVPAWVDEPVVTAGQVAGVVITIDHFGNLVTNIEATMIRHFPHPVVWVGGHTFPVRRTYGEVRPGEDLALINSFGVIEIARAEQSAAAALGVGRGAPVVVREQ